MSEEIKIETDVPIPTYAKVRYPFKEMKVGESFYVPASDAGSINGSLGYANKNKQGWEYTSRTIKENGVKVGVRVWRTK